MPNGRLTLTGGLDVGHDATLLDKELKHIYTISAGSQPDMIAREDGQR